MLQRHQFVVHHHKAGVLEVLLDLVSYLGGWGLVDLVVVEVLRRGVVAGYY